MMANGQKGITVTFMHFSLDLYLSFLRHPVSMEATISEVADISGDSCARASKSFFKLKDIRIKIAFTNTALNTNGNSAKLQRHMSQLNESGRERDNYSRWTENVSRLCQIPVPWYQ